MFLGTSGATAAAVALVPTAARASTLSSQDGITVGLGTVSNEAYQVMVTPITLTV
jgi:hypothetical protein